MSSHSKPTLLTNSLWRLAQVTGAGLFAVGFLYIYTSQLSKTDYGTYGIAITVAALFNIVGGFGLQRTVGRFVARHRGAGELGAAQRCIEIALQLGFAFSVGAAGLYLASTVAFPERFASWPVAVRWSLAVLIAAKSITFTLQGTLEGAGLFRRVSVTTFALGVFHLVLVLALWSQGLSAGVIVSIEATVAVAGLLVFGNDVRRLHGSYDDADDRASVTHRQLLGFSFVLVLTAAAGFLYSKVDILFIDHYLDQGAAADYFLLLSLFDVPLVALGAYVYVLNTEVAVALGQGRSDGIRTLFWRSERIGALLGLGLMSLFYGASHLVPMLLPQYAEAARLMRIAAPLLLVKSISQVASGAFMISLGRPELLAKLTVLGGALNVILNFVLIPHHGLDGAVYSTVIGHTLLAVLTVGFAAHSVRRITGDEP